MAENTITGLFPDIYEALDVVSRELTGLIPAVTLSASAETAALNQEIVVGAEPTGNVSDITPAMAIPEPTAQTSGASSVIITKSRAAEFGFIGDQQKALNTGAGFAQSRAGKIAQAIRALVNEVEADLAGLQSTFSRAYGTPTTTPFGTANDYTDASNVMKILKDNGAPKSDNQLVIDTTSGANFIGKQSAVNAAGTDSMLRQGVLLDLAGMPLRESAEIVTQTKGAMASATTTASAQTVGQTAIPLATAGTGVVAAGDIITLAGDTNKYAVTSVAFAGANPASGDIITIAEPGLQVAQTSSAKAITVVATAARNMCFNRSALILAARAPARPVEGDMAEDVTIITDPYSGLSLEFAMYKGYRKVRYEVGLAWGVKNIKPAHTALLLG